MIQKIAPAETRLAFAAMKELRPQLPTEEAFVRLVDETLRPAGYRLVGAFENGRTHAAAIAGFHLGSSIPWGHYLYVDDLSTQPEARRRGHARALLDWLVAEGRRLGCDQLHLDSGVGAERIDAHRLYLNSGLYISSYHFARGLAEAEDARPSP
jgi:GNAT superfamily N-acetyltransferase